MPGERADECEARIHQGHWWWIRGLRAEVTPKKQGREVVPSSIQRVNSMGNDD